VSSRGIIEPNDYSKITLGLGLAGANQALSKGMVIAQSSPFGVLFIDRMAHSACLGAF